MAKQIRALQLVLNRLRSQEDSAARQEFVTRVIFTLASFGVALISVLVIGLVLTNQADLETVVLTVFVGAVVLLGWLFLARGRWRISAAFLPLVPLAVAGYMVYTAGPVTTGVMQLLLAVLLAGMLSGNQARWLTVALAGLVYFGAGWASDGLDLEILLTSGSLLLVTLVTVALLERFFTDQLDKSQATVREREGELESIFRVAPVGIGMVVDRVIMEANPTLCQMTGYSREELVGQRARMLYPTEEEFEYVGLEKYRQISQVGKGTVETRWLRKDGDVRDILLSSVPLDLNDLSRGVTFSALDISESKQAQRALQASKDLLYESQRMALIGHYTLDLVTGVGEVSEGLAYLFGIDSAFHTSLDGWLETVHPEDQETISLYFNEVVQNHQNFDREYRIVRLSDGETRWVHGLGRLEFDDNGNPVRMIGNIQDTTERKRAAQALQESEEQYRLLFDEMLSGFALHEIICDQDGMPVDYRFLAVNRAFENLTGLKAHDLIGRTALEVLPGIEPFWIERYGRVALEGADVQFDGFIADLGKFFEARAFSPERGKFAVMFHDMTERKQAEEEVWKSKQALEEAERLVHLGHYEIDTRTGKAIWSDEMFNIFGLDCKAKEPTVETYNAFVHPDDRAAVYALYEESRQRRVPFDLVYRILRKDGNIRYVRSYANVIEDAAGNAKLFGTFQDVTELKEVELALQESQTLYHDLVETAQDLIWQCDREGRYTYLNPAWVEVFGYELNEMVGKPFTAFQPPEYASRDMDTFLCLLQGNSVSRYETIHMARDGSLLHLVFNAKAVRDHHGNIIGIRGTAYDITQRKQAEIALQESAARYQAVVENQTEFIVRWNPGGRRTFVNEAYLRYFNLTPEDALNSGFLPLVTEDDRRAVTEKVSRLVSCQATSETDIHRVIKPDGSIGWQEWTDHAIYNERGEIVEFQSVGRDVTERIQAEQALRTKTKELEALFSISSHLRTAQSAHAMLPLVLEEMRRVLRSDANAVILLDPDHEHFTYALGDGPLAVNDKLQFTAENSISGLVLKTGQAYLTEDLSSDPRRASGVQGNEDLGPAVVVPVVSESEFLGVLLCAREKNSASQQFTPSEVRLLTAVGEMVGNALRRARLYDQALKRMQHLQTLHSIDTAISTNLDLGVILDVLLMQGMAQLNVDAASVLLLNPHTHMLEFAAGKGFRTRKIESSRLRLGEGLPGQVALERKALHIPNMEIAKVMRNFFLEEAFVSYQGVPLIAKGQLQGVLEVFNRAAIEIDEERTEFLETLAIQAAIAIDNSQLFSDLQRTNFELEMAYDATIEGWSRALELRDLETEGHTLRVTDMTVQLAQELGVPSGELIHIRRGALLHDIGKMGVPDRILLKPGKLDQEEWEVMKRHTLYAREMLWPIEFLRPAIEIPYCHHERWDGSGYPRQLKAEQIPLSARLFAVADVWDALTNNRPYRKAWTIGKALDYIQSNAGKHFDPRVVEIFLILHHKQGQEFAFE